VTPITPHVVGKSVPRLGGTLALHYSLLATRIIAWVLTWVRYMSRQKSEKRIDATFPQPRSLIDNSLLFELTYTREPHPD
jgi:hypothetical protein